MDCVAVLYLATRSICMQQPLALLTKELKGQVSLTWENEKMHVIYTCFKFLYKNTRLHVVLVQSRKPRYKDPGLRGWFFRMRIIDEC